MRLLFDNGHTEEQQSSQSSSSTPTLNDTIGITWMLCMPLILTTITTDLQLVVVRTSWSLAAVDNSWNINFGVGGFGNELLQSTCVIPRSSRNPPFTIIGLLVLHLWVGARFGDTASDNAFGQCGDTRPMLRSGLVGPANSFKGEIAVQSELVHQQNSTWQMRFSRSENHKMPRNQRCNANDAPFAAKVDK